MTSKEKRVSKRAPKVGVANVAPKTNGATNGNGSVAAAQAALEQDKRERATQCGAEMQVILEKYRCSMAALTQIVGDKVTQSIQVLAKD